MGTLIMSLEQWTPFDATRWIHQPRINLKEHDRLADLITEAKELYNHRHTTDYDRTTKATIRDDYWVAWKAAVNELAEAHYWVAGRWAFRGPKTSPFEDRAQVAFMGVMRAAETFDRRKAKFATYAYGWAFQFLQKQHEDHMMIRWPTYQVKEAHRIHKKSESERTEEEKLFLHRNDKCKNILCIYTPDKKGQTLAEKVPAPGPDGAEPLDIEWLSSRMTVELDRLPGIRKQILERHIEGQTLREIADEFGVTHQAISLKKIDGLNRLRKSLAYVGEEWFGNE